MTLFRYIYFKYLENGHEYQEILKEITGKTTVPQVFFRGEFVGRLSKATHHLLTELLYNPTHECFLFSSRWL